MPVKKYLIISYPRSGVNWVAYIIDAIWHIKTVGITPDYEAPVFFDNHRPDKVVKRCHAHRTFELPLIMQSDKVLLLLRNPIEAISSHLIRKGSSLTFKNIIEQLKGEAPTPDTEDRTDWLSTIKLFNQFSGDKSIIYYEDLMQFPEPEIKNICNFIEEREDPIKFFMPYISTHINNSINNYSTLGVTKTAISKDINFYKKKLKPEYVDNIIKMLENVDEELKTHFKRYLTSRYT